MQINNFFLGLITCVKLTLYWTDMEYHLVNFTTDIWHKISSNLIKIQLIVSKARRVHEYYALFYVIYTDYIKIPSLCVLSPKELVSADTLISLLAHGRYA
jgi:hypothetical protein